MTDKPKASEHDLREGSKPTCPKCHSATASIYYVAVFGENRFKHEGYCNEVACLYIGEGSEFFPIAAILEENQELRIDAEAADIYAKDLAESEKAREAIEAENQRLAKDLADNEAEDDKNYALYCAEKARAEAAEGRLEKVREALKNIAEYPNGHCDCDHSDDDCCAKVGEHCARCIAEAALAE